MSDESSDTGFSSIERITRVMDECRGVDPRSCYYIAAKVYLFQLMHRELGVRVDLYDRTMLFQKDSPVLQLLDSAWVENTNDTYNSLKAITHQCRAPVQLYHARGFSLHGNAQTLKFTPTPITGQLVFLKFAGQAGVLFGETGVLYHTVPADTVCTTL